MMKVEKLWCFLLYSMGILMVRCSASLPQRNCSISITLTPSTALGHGNERCSYLVNDKDGSVSGKCELLSDYLQMYGGRINNGDCLRVQLLSGNYTMDNTVATSITYSLVLQAAEGARVTISCLDVSQALAPNDHLVFQRIDTLLQPDRELFVQMFGISFQNCPGSLQFDFLDYVGLSNCSFSELTASAVDIFNCQRVQIEKCMFRNNVANVTKAVHQPNAGALGIAYHTNNTRYYNESLSPSVTITDCQFVGNVASFGLNSQEQIFQAGNQIYNGRGGGLGFFFYEYFVDVSIMVNSCMFDSNFANAFGGGIYIITGGGNNTHHVLTVTDSNFTSNVARNEYGGGIFAGFTVQNEHSEPSHLYFSRCHFISNTAEFGGGLGVVQTFSRGSGNQVHLTDSYFENNTASSVGSGVMFASLLYSQNRRPSHYYQVSKNVFFNNYSPGGTFAVGFIPQSFTGHNEFLNNTGPALRSVGAQIAVNGNISFVGNNAEKEEGGALYLSQFGQVKLYRGTHIKFLENRGRIGAAIVVDVQRMSQVFSRLIFNTQCFLIYENQTEAPDSWDQVTMSFSGNTAVVAPVVYTSHLDLCSWYSFSYSSNHIVSNFSIHDFPNWPVFNRSIGLNNATSHPNGTSPEYYFQTQARTITSQIRSNNQNGVFPGDTINIEMKGLDQFNLPTYFIARILDSRANVNQGAFSQTADTRVFEIHGEGEPVMIEPSLVPVSPNDQSVKVEYNTKDDLSTTTTTIDVTVDAPYNVIDVKQLTLNFSTTFCLPGYKLKEKSDGYKTCSCQDTNFYIVDCDDSRNIIYLRNGLWGSATEDKRLMTHVCPSPYCQCSDTNSFSCDSLFYHDEPNRQCHGLRKGTLCGRCKNDTSVGVLRFNCRTCDSQNYWALLFLVLGDVIVCVLILLALVKLSYTFPHSMRGLLFYVQTVYYTTEYFPASFWDARQYMLYIGSVLGLYFPWDFCLGPGNTALQSFPPRFVPPLIALLVTIAAVVTVFYCFEKRAQKRIWHGVWAFVLLLYAPLVYTCVSLLHCPSVPPAYSGDPSPRWFLDGEVKCFKDAGHAVMGILAISCLFFLGLLPFVIFIFFLFVSHSTSLKQKYSAIDRLSKAVKAGYTDRTRWWGAWDLLRRLILVTIVVATPGRSVSALYVLVPALALHLYWLPYHKWWQNLLESLILGNYCLLHLLGSTQHILDSLSSYTGTAIKESRGTQLAKEDRLTALFSFWLYLPLLLSAIATFILTTRLIVKKTMKMKRTMSVVVTSETEQDCDNASDYYHINLGRVPSTDVSIN